MNAEHRKQIVVASSIAQAHGISMSESMLIAKTAIASYKAELLGRPNPDRRLQGMTASR